MATVGMLAVNGLLAQTDEGVGHWVVEQIAKHRSQISSESHPAVFNYEGHIVEEGWPKRERVHVVARLGRNSNLGGTS